MFGAAPLLGTPLRVLSSPTRVVGISTGLNDDEVVVTQQAQGVAVYNVSSRARVAAWELPAAVRLTHAAQAHGPSRQYVVVRDHTRLLGWAETDDAIDAEAGLTFDQPIATLLQSPALHDCLAAVPMDGSAIILCAAVGGTSRSASSAAVATVPAPDGDELTVWACLTPLASAASGARLPLCLLLLSRSNSAALTLRVRALEPHLGGDGGTSAPLVSVGVLPARTVELGLPEPSATTALSLAAASGGRAKRGAKASAPAESTPYLSGCCVVPSTGGGAGTDAGGRGATLMLLWPTGQMQVWDVPAPLDRSHHGARGGRQGALALPGTPGVASADAAEPAHPRCSRSLRGLALPSIPSAVTVNGPAFSTSATGHPSAPPPPCGLLALGASPLVLLLAAGAGAGARTPPAPFSLTPRLEPRAWPELASADRPAAAPHPMSLGSSPALGPALGSGRVVLQLWDARFGMLHAHRRDTADELPPGSRGTVGGAALCGGGRWVALAFDDAVLALSVPPPHHTFGLVHALNAAVRTADALTPEEASALTRPPLCAAPFISSVLSAHAPGQAHNRQTHTPAAASAVGALPTPDAVSAAEGGKRGKSRHGAKRAEAAASSSSAPAVAPFPSETPSPTPASSTSSRGHPATGLAPAAGRALGHRPVPVAPSELCGWRDRVLSGAARESAVLLVLLDPSTQAPAFESALRAFLEVMAEEAAARAADEEGHPRAPGAAGGAGRGALTEEGDAACPPGGAAAVDPKGKRRRRGSNGGAHGGGNGGANGIGDAAEATAEGEGARLSKRAKGRSGAGPKGRAAQVYAVTDSSRAASGAGDGQQAGASGGNAGVRAGLSLAAALDGESQPKDGASCAGSGRARGALYVSPGFVGSVCERCVREGSVEWLRLLKPLIEAGALPSGAQEPSLLQALCAVRELDLLMTYVRHAADLDAANLLMLLRISLRECARAAAEAPAAALAALPARATPASLCGDGVPSDGPAAGNGPTQAAGHSIVTARSHAAARTEGWGVLLDLLICAPRNDVFLLEALRWLSPTDALLLLSRLLELFQAYAGAWRLGSAEADADGWRTPTISQLVGWTNVLLDAHASQLLMHAPAHGPLRTLGGLVRRHVQLCGAMKGLKGYLSQATLKQAQPIKPIPDYSVEILEM